ncbi:MAG TPA: sigma-70 family RNA polymerase sigma factor [Pyrinomonadaceae bacterium]|nr:sigma-70 family RNA polymerase sigma factor [Pyrinomonadaceae bacterium]
MFFSRSITFGDEDLNAVAARPVDERLRADADFVDRLKNGDSLAYDILVTRYSGQIYGLLYRLTQDAEEAADLTQDTFLQVLRSIRKFRGDSELKTWLFRIAINESRNRFRWWKRRKRESTVSLDAQPASDGLPLNETLPDTSEDPERILMRKQEREQIERALDDLPLPFREAVVLCDIEGQSYQEIATILGINIGTVKSRIARGREEMRKKLSDF